MASSSVPSDALDNLKKRLFDAGRRNDSTRDIIVGYGLENIQPDLVVGTNLELKLLHIAAWTGDVETIQDLKRKNLSDPAEKTKGGFTALHLAASRGHRRVLSKVLKWNDVRRTISDEGFTPLHQAAYGGHLESVKLLKVNEIIDAKDSVFQRTALHFAAQGEAQAATNYEKIVEMLIADGADVRSKDKVRSLTPFLLVAMKPKDKCSLSLVTRLLDKKVDQDQIHDKVGNLTKEMEREASTFHKQVWRVLDQIHIDVRPTPVEGSDCNVGPPEDNEDQYRKFKVPMEGHTALHLGATQNNSELVSHLVKIKDVPLNEGDTQFGMTPLHCAIMTGAMEAFSALMAVDQVNTSAKLVEGGRCERPSWLPCKSKFALHAEFKEFQNLELFRKFERFDTPLHLAMRICKVEDILEMVTEFCNHPKFNAAILNKAKQSPLDLAWIRYMFCARTPSIFAFRSKASAIPQMPVEEKYVYGDAFHLNRVLDLLERHSTTAALMTTLAAKRKAVQDSVNGFLVTATLIAGLTFNAYAQPSSGTDVAEYGEIPARLFWSFNGLSFYFAVYTILRCLLTMMRGDQRSDNLPYQIDIMHLIRIQSAVPLTMSVGFAIGAFAVAGYGKSPLENNRLMWTCMSSGLLLVLYQMLRNIYVAFRTLVEILLVKSWNAEAPVVRRQYVEAIFSFLGGLVSLIKLFYSSNKFRFEFANKIVTFHQCLFNYMLNIAFGGILVYGAVVLLVYTLVDIFLN